MNKFVDIVAVTCVCLFWSAGNANELPSSQAWLIVSHELDNREQVSGLVGYYVIFTDDQIVLLDRDNRLFRFHEIEKKVDLPDKLTGLISRDNWRKFAASIKSSKDGNVEYLRWSFKEIQSDNAPTEYPKDGDKGVYSLELREAKYDAAMELLGKSRHGYVSYALLDGRVVKEVVYLE